MPLQVNREIPTSKPARVPYRSYEDICDALRAKGIDPDVLERAMMPKFLQQQWKEEEVRAALRERGHRPGHPQSCSRRHRCDGAEIYPVQETGPGAVKHRWRFVRRRR
jgi:hypothetical protein